MTRANRSTARAGIAAALLILLAIILRNSVRWTGHGPLEVAAAFGRVSIYLGLFAAWGVSLRRRIVQAQERRCLVATAVLMILWMTVRTLKYRVFEAPAPDRFCWYFYYVPMLLIPMLGFFAADAMGRPEDYRTPRRIRLLLIPTVLLALIVLTNDLHELVFSFPPELPRTDAHYSYAPLYWVVIAWELGSAALALGTILHKCRIPRSKKLIWLPLIPFALVIGYLPCYLLHFKWLWVITGDMTVTVCVLVIAIFESCIQSGLIQSNTHYDELFGASTIAALITDGDYRVLLSSKPDMDIPAEAMRGTETAPVQLSDSLRLSGAPIRCGHVIWQEDVSALTRALEELEYTNEYLKGKNQVLAEYYKTSRLRRHLVEQNRLYNEMQDQTAGRVALLSGLVTRLDAAEEEGEIKGLLLRILVLGVYIKRRNNLIFLAEEQNRIPSSELRNFLGELTQSFLLCGIACDHCQVEERELTVSCLIRLYDALETVLEKTTARITALYTAVRFEAEQAVMTVRLSGMETAPELPELPEDRLLLENEEGEWLVTCRIPMGGEKE